MLKEIRKQPEHIRALFMWLSVFIVFSLVVFVWLNSFQNKLAVLLAPEEQDQAKDQSPFSVIGQSLGDLKATISDLFGLASGTKKEAEVKDNLKERFGVKVEPRLLPVTEE